MEKNPSHILRIILIAITIISIVLSNNMIEQLEKNLIKKADEIENLKVELVLINNKMQNIRMNLINCEAKSIKENESEWKKFFITGYTARSGEQGTNEIVATMFNLDLNRVRNLPIIAVDPKVIPLYSIVEIKDLGVFIALDTGGLIKGNKIDILCPNIKTTYEITGEYLVRILEKGIILTD